MSGKQDHLESEASGQSINNQSINTSKRAQVLAACVGNYHMCPKINGFSRTLGKGEIVPNIYLSGELNQFLGFQNLLEDSRDR